MQERPITAKRRLPSPPGPAEAAEAGAYGRGVLEIP